MNSLSENKSKSLLFVFICIILWAFIPVVSRLGQQNLDNYQFLFWSSLLSFVALFVGTVLAGKLSVLKEYKKRDILNAIGLGFIGSFLYYLLLYFGYAHAEGLEVLVIQYTWPIFVIIFSMFFLNEKINLRNVVAIILGFVGVLIVLTDGCLGLVDLSNLSVDLVVLFAASLFALFSVLGKKVNLEPFSATTLFFLSATVFSFIAMLLFSSFKMPTSSELPAILLNGLLVNGFSYIFWLKGLSYAKASFVAPFIFLVPVLGTFLIILFFQEPFSISCVSGLSFVILGGLVAR